MSDSQGNVMLDDFSKISENINKKGATLIFPSKFMGGHEIMTVQIINRMISQGHVSPNKFKCIVPNENKVLQSKLDQHSISYECFKANTHNPEFLYALLNPFYLKKCINIFRAVPKDNYVILVQGDILQGTGFLLAGMLSSNKVISYIPYVHSFKKMGAKFATLKDIFAAFFFKSTNHYITISKCFKEDIESKNSTASVLLVNNFVDKVPDKFPKRNLTESDKINIFILGRVQFHQKGHDVLFDALSGITNRQIKIHVVGDGPDLPQLQLLGTGLPDNINVEFHGWVSDSWAVAKEHNIDLLVIPSQFEGVPLVMLEALERDVDVIAAGRDGMLDYLPENSLYTVSADEVTALRNKILCHIQNRLV